MKKPTKNELTRQEIIKELTERNAAEIDSSILILIASAIVLPAFTALALYSANLLLIGNILVALLLNAPLIALIYALIISIREKIYLSRGEFVVTVRQLDGKKMRRAYKSGTYRYLYFEGFWKMLVDYYTYEYATPKREYFLIHYKKSKSVKLVYPTNAYELK